MRAVAIGLLLVLVGCTSDPPDAERPEPSPSPTPTVWDPRDVDELPAAADEVAPALPDQVDPPDTAPALATKPLDAAVLSVDRRGGRVQLLGVDGSWREVRLPNPHGRLALTREQLSPDGTRLAALLDDGIEVWHLPTGERKRLSLPAAYEPWDFSWIDWPDDGSLLLDDLKGGWRIDIITGTADRTAYPTGMSFGWTLDDQGAVVEVSDPAEEDVLTDWGDGVRRLLDMSATGRLSSIQAGGETVVGTSYEDGDFAVYDVDRGDLSPRHRLRVRDHEGNYSNWGLHPVALLGDDSVLLWVAVPHRRAEEDGWRIVRWVPDTNRLEVVTTSEADPSEPMTFAADLLQ